MIATNLYKIGTQTSFMENAPSLIVRFFQKFNSANVIKLQIIILSFISRKFLISEFEL